MPVRSLVMLQFTDGVIGTISNSRHAAYGYDQQFHWLEDHGVQSIQAINKMVAHGAIPWWDVYGGKDNIEVIEPGNITR